VTGYRLMALTGRSGLLAETPQVNCSLPTPASVQHVKSVAQRLHRIKASYRISPLKLPTAHNPVNEYAKRADFRAFARISRLV